MKLLCNLMLLAVLNSTVGLFSLARTLQPSSQAVLASSLIRGHNEPYFPTPDQPVPGKVPFEIDETSHYFEKYVNGSKNGYYRRSSCPAVNAMANRGYINRSGRNITYEEIARAARDVWNFGDDNVCIPNYLHFLRPSVAHSLPQIMLALWPAFAAHPGAVTLDLDMFAVGVN